MAPSNCKRISLWASVVLMIVVFVSSISYAQPSTSSVLVLPDISHLKALGSSSQFYPQVYVKGYSSAGDGGGGQVYWDSASTATATVCGPFQATGVSTGRWFWQQNGTISAGQCGGGAGVSDNGVAINAAIKYASDGLADQVVINTGNSNWNFSTPITNINNVRVTVSGSGALNYTGSGSDAVTIGNASAIVTTVNPAPSVWVLQRNSVDFSDQHSGITFQNLYEGNFIIRVRNFQRGIEFHGLNTFGNAYIHVHAAQILDAQKAVYFLNDSSGYNNQNVIEAMSISNSSSTNSSSRVSCIVFENNSSFVINGNSFEHPSCEINNTGSGGVTFLETLGSASGIVAQNNLFDFPRMESAATSGGEYLISGTAIVQRNTFRNMGYVALTAPYLNSSTASVLTALSYNEFTFTDYPRTGWSEPSSMVTIGRSNIVGRDSSGTPEVESPARGKWYSTPNSFVNEVGSGVTLGSGDISITGGGVGLVTFINTKNTPTDILRKIHLTANVISTGGRFMVKTYNSSGTELTTASDVQFSQTLTYSGVSNWWSSGVDLTTQNNYIDIMYSSNVAYIAVGLIKGTANADFTSFNVEAPRGSGATLLLDSTALSALGSGLPIFDSEDPLSLGIPNSTDPLGKRAWSIGTVASGNPPGWISDGSAWHALANLP